MNGRPPPQPVPRALTLREELRDRLRDGPATARELSARVGIREREVTGHLEHLARTLAAGSERLAIDPAACLACGYVFRGRSRLARPSACPRCRSTHLAPPAFRIERLSG